MRANDHKVKNSAGGGVFLDRVRGGRSARIVALHGDSDSVSRLHALGFLPGRMVRHRNTAPLGDPVAFEIQGQKISMRRSEARLVEVVELSDDPSIVDGGAGEFHAGKLP
jgi:ferrous iron transport protein A